MKGQSQALYSGVSFSLGGAPGAFLVSICFFSHQTAFPGKISGFVDIYKIRLIESSLFSISK